MVNDGLTMLMNGMVPSGKFTKLDPAKSPICNENSSWKPYLPARVFLWVYWRAGFWSTKNRTTFLGLTSGSQPARLLGAWSGWWSPVASRKARVFRIFPPLVFFGEVAATQGFEVSGDGQNPGPLWFLTLVHWSCTPKHTVAYLFTPK